MRIILTIVFLYVHASASVEELQGSYIASLQEAKTKQEIEHLNQQIFKAKSLFYFCEQEVSNKYYPINCFKLNLLSLELRWGNRYATSKFVDYLNSFCINKARSLKGEVNLLSNMNLICRKRLLHQGGVNKYKNEFEW